MKALIKSIDYKKTITLAVLLAVLWFSISTMPVQSSVAPTIIMEREPLGTGLVEGTDAQKNWMGNNVPIVVSVKMNTLALERLNADRTARGLSAISAADAGAVTPGEELVYSGSSDLLGGEMLPNSADNSLTAYFPPIRSQGSLGSCVAWATTYYAYTYEINYALGRTANTGDNSVIFSPKWTYNMINFGANSGAYFSDAFYLLTKHGAATWAEFPYDSNYLQWCLDTEAWRDALNHRATGWSQVYNSNTTALISQLKTQLANGHVLVIGTYVSSWAYTYIKNDQATSADDAFVNQRIATYMKNTRLGGHGMTLVGYNDNIWCDLNGNGVVDSGEKGAFKIANSWGTSDWNSGYRWVTYDSLYGVSQVASYGSWPTTDRYASGIFRGGDIYALSVSSSYSPKVVAEFTVNCLNRGELYMNLGVGEVTSSTPSSSWYPEAIYGSGGVYAFDGTRVATNGTFIFDFTDIVPSATALKRWFVGMRDSATGNVATIKSFKLYQVTESGDVLVGTSAITPKTADASLSYVWVDYQYNSLKSPPTASMSASPTSGLAPLTVNFDGSASRDTDGTITSYAWSFGDGSSGSGATVAHVYANAGSYVARLTVTDNDGSTSTSSKTITVTAASANIAPTAAMTTNATGGLAPLYVAFSGSASTDSDGTITSYAWSFGDGSSGSGATVAHVYANAGTYTATLTVTDDDGAAGSTSKSIAVTVDSDNTAPIAMVSMNDTSGYAPLCVYFSARSSSDADGTLVGFDWNFGDGQTGEGTNVVHTYYAAGTFIVTLTVTDDDGAMSISRRAITVYGSSANIAPTAVAKANTTSGYAPLGVLFNGSASTDSDGTITSYAWSFGDGSSGSGATVAHVYANAGTYTATLTVTDDDGAAKSSTVSITVTAVSQNQAPTALVTANITSGYAPMFVAFDGSGSTDSDGTIANYQWNFGDGAQGTGARVNHAYSTSGTYTVVLTVTDDDGAKSTSSKTVTVMTLSVNKSPTAVAKANTTSGYAPLGVLFNGSASTDSDGTITSYAWSFGDGSSGSGATVAHVYANAGTYTATLTVTDDDGAANSSTVVIAVAPAISYSINAPSDLHALESANKVSLIWKDNSNNEGGFLVERATRVKGSTYTSFTVIATLGPNTTSYVDYVASGAYAYRVSAFNAYASAYSSQIIVRV